MALLSEQLGGVVAFGSVRKNRNDRFAGAELFGQLNGGGHVGTAGDTACQAFLPGQADSFRRKFGMDIWNVYGPVMKKYERSGHLVCDREQHRIRLTDRGIDVSNIVLADFLL